MAWSYTQRAADQLYADDEHGPVIFDPGATVGVPGSGNVISVGTPLLNQIALWTDATHIAGATVLPAVAHPALTGDVTVASGTTVTAYNNPLPTSKGGLPIGGTSGQVLAKNTSASYDVGWVTGGGNVSNTGTPVANQLALWADATHIQGVAALPAANMPALAGDITSTAGTFATVYNNAVPTAKGGLPSGGTAGYILQKNTGTSYDVSWVVMPASGGNVANSGSPQAGQLALWTDATHIQGLTALPSTNFPALTGDITVTGGTLVTAYGNAVPTAKGGVPAGGTVNQILQKNSGSNYDVGWVTPSAAGGVTSVFSRTGAIVATTGDYTFAQIGSKPTTIAGYGITDAFTQGAADLLYAPVAHTHSFASLTTKPTTIAGYGITDAQPLDTDLTTLAGLSSSTDNFIVGVANVWSARTPAQVRTTLGLVIGTNVQAWDADLDAIAATASQTAFGRGFLPLVDAAGARTYIGAQVTGAYEPALGNPGTSGYILSSTTGGVRSWIAASGGTPAGASGQFQYNNAGAFGAVAAMSFDGTIPATIAKTGLNTFGVGMLLQNTSTTTLDSDNATSPALIFKQHAHYSGADHVIESKLEAKDQCLVFQNRTDGGVWEPGFALSSNPAGGALVEYGGDIQIIAAVLRGLDDVTTGGDGGHPTRIGMFNYSTTARPGISMTSDAFIGWAIPSSPVYQSWEAQNDTLIQRAAAGEVGIYSVGTTLGVMRVATAAPGDNSTKSATTAFVTAAVAASAGSAISEKGNTPLVSGQNYVDVTFLVAQPYTTWRFLELIIVNTTDANPLNIMPGLVTAKSTTGFRLNLNGAPDTSNYALYWAISPATVAVPATTYLFSGPSGGAVNVASTNFTVHLIADTSVTGTVTVTPNSGGAGGTFTPTTVALTTASPAATFTFTPTSGGAATISVTNNGGLTNPSGVVYTATATYTGSPVLDTSYAGAGGTGTNQGLGGGSVSGNCVGLGESFTSTGGMLDHAVGLGWYNGGILPGNVVCKLYAVSPAIFREAQAKPGAEDEVNPLPGRGLEISLMAVPGTLLATSNTVVAASIPAGGNVTFTFAGAQRYVMAAGTQYVIAFEYNSGVEAQSVIVPWYYGTAYPGSMVENDSGVIPPTLANWYVHGGDHDIPFEVWVVKPD